ncbi:MAG: hypothetical protein HKN23_10275 [Verrucomicrobiales bacterium]|nr:hypothetical protein [Verrucomicrobiales bacterium]
MNEKRVFSNKKVQEKLEELDVVLIQADNTARKPEIDTDIRRFDRVQLPVNIVVPSDPDQPLILMPELISPEDAIRALELAARGSEEKDVAIVAE